MWVLIDEYYKVIGPFATEAEAEAKAKELGVFGMELQVEKIQTVKEYTE